MVRPATGSGVGVIGSGVAVRIAVGGIAVAVGAIAVALGGNGVGDSTCVGVALGVDVGSADGLAVAAGVGARVCGCVAALHAQSMSSRPRAATFLRYIVCLPNMHFVVRTGRWFWFCDRSNA